MRPEVGEGLVYTLNGRADQSRNVLRGHQSGRCALPPCSAHRALSPQKEELMPYPLQPEQPPDWVCPLCEKLMRVRTIEVANGEEQITLACVACGTEATQTKVLAD
jgi:hypothetical protein